MNPLPLVALLLLSQKRGAPALPNFDTQSMETMLDGLHRTVNTLEKINRVNHLAQEPLHIGRAPEIFEALCAPPEVKNMIAAGSAFLAGGFGNNRAGNRSFLPSEQMPYTHSLPLPSEQVPYEERDPYVMSPEPPEFYEEDAYENKNQFYHTPQKKTSSPPQSFSGDSSIQMPDLTQLMQTFGPMLKAFLQNSGE